MYIIATISKNSFTADKIESILKAGATALRYNFSHGSPEEMAEKITTARGVISKLKLKGKVKIIADLPGNKLRLGQFNPNIEVDRGDLVTFASQPVANPTMVPVAVDNISSYLGTGQIITLGDGEIGFKVKEILNLSAFTAEALNNGQIPSMKAINVGDGIDKLDHITPQTLEHIENLIKIKPEFIAFSFVNSVEMLNKFKQKLNIYLTKDWQPQIISKIETPLGIQNRKEITTISDLIMVARGDLGLTSPIEQLGISEQLLIREAKAQGKPVIVATQLLDSLMDYYIPKRAEVSALTWLVLQKVEAIMFAKETGIAEDPTLAIAFAKRVIEAIESSELA